MTTLREVKDQIIAQQKIRDFLAGPDRIFRLTGRAGSGKTTIIRGALQDMIDEDTVNGYCSNVAGICLAHNAKKVLRKSIPFTYTFAKAFGYKEKINEDTGERTFEPLTFFPEPPIGHQNLRVFVFDECSMISHAMLKIILEKVSMFAKIIFMGDIIQLPPIDTSMKVDEDSPVFTIPLEERNQHELWEPMRQAQDHPLIGLADIIIEEVRNRTYDINRVNNKIFEQQVVNGLGYQLVKEVNMYADYIANGNYLDSKIIAYRKNAVAKYNNHIRNIVMNGPREPLVEGDYIFLTNNFLQKEPIPFQLNNADQFKVMDVTEQEEIHNNMKITTLIGRVESEEFGQAYIRTVPSRSRNLHDAIIKSLETQARQNGSLWKFFWNYKDEFTDYTPAYAINAYRCQGATYKDIYVDLLDVYNNRYLTPKRMLQSIYTMITRAQEMVHFTIP